MLLGVEYKCFSFSGYYPSPDFAPWGAALISALFGGSNPLFCTKRYTVILLVLPTMKSCLQPLALLWQEGSPRNCDDKRMCPDFSNRGWNSWAQVHRLLTLYLLRGILGVESAHLPRWAPSLPLAGMHEWTGCLTLLSRSCNRNAPISGKRRAWRQSKQSLRQG